MFPDYIDMICNYLNAHMLMFLSFFKIMFKNGKPLSTELLLHALSCFWIEMGNLIKIQKMNIVTSRTEVLKCWIRTVVLHGKMLSTLV